MSEFQPTQAELQAAEEGYIHYLTGVAVLHAPESTCSIHARELPADNESIIVHAEKLIYDGLQDVIRFANSREVRSNMAVLEHRFDDALPHLLETQSRTYRRHEHRLRGLNPAFEWLRPFPLRDESVYRYVCHGRLGKLTTIRLLDGIAPAKELEYLLSDRTLRNLSAVKTN